MSKVGLEGLVHTLMPVLHAEQTCVLIQATDGARRILKLSN